MAEWKDWDGDVIAHREWPDVWHVTVRVADYVRLWGRVYRTHCGLLIPVLQSVAGELRPRGEPETGPLPTCAECLRCHLLDLLEAQYRGS